MSGIQDSTRGLYTGTTLALYLYWRFGKILCFRVLPRISQVRLQPILPLNIRNLKN